MKLSILKERPKTRAQCEGHDGPCPWISCRYHLAHDFAAPRHKSRTPTDDQIVEFIATAKHTCALDAADDGPHSTRDIAGMMGTTRPVIDHTIATAARKSRGTQAAADFADAVADVVSRRPIDHDQDSTGPSW